VRFRTQAQDELRAAEAALRAAEARLCEAGERARGTRAELAVARASAVAQREEYGGVCGQVAHTLTFPSTLRSFNFWWFLGLPSILRAQDVCMWGL
jgi:Tfp pilus assembly protein PilX